MDSLTLVLHGRQIDETRQALSTRWTALDKRAKANESENIQSDAREKMIVLEEIIRAMEPQLDLTNGIELPPESFTQDDTNA